MNYRGSPLVSIVSVFHNRVALVDESVRSMLAQDYPNFEIMIYDDGSTDGTAEALNAFDDPRLRVVTQPNAGFTRTLNRAIRDSRGEIVALHGSGDTTTPDRISKQVDALLRGENVALVGCITDRASSRKAPLAKTNRQMSGNIHQRALTSGLIFTHGAAMFRRKLFDEIGGYREFFELAQGRDFYLRFPLHLDYLIVPETLYYKVTPPGSIGASAQKLVLQRYLTEFAVQCARTRDRGEGDPLEKMGPLSLLLRDRTSAVQRPLGYLGKRWLCFGDEEGGRTLLLAAAAECLNWRSVVDRVLVETSRRPVVWRLVRPMLRRIYVLRAAAPDDS